MKTVRDISAKLKSGKSDPIMLYRRYLQRIDQVEDQVNAYVTVTTSEGLEEAKQSAKRYQEGKSRSELDGVPVGIKDVFCTKGLKSTASSRMLEDFVPHYDATVVKKLKEAGAVIIGKNNCDAWAHGASTEHSDFGPTKNPWSLDKVPGGSSGGSAAAVAAGECAFSIGSDTGGSIRQPAAFCGVVGVKPTYGRVSRYGLIAMGSSLDCVGPLTTCVYDAASVMEVIAGQDSHDSTTVPVEVPKYTKLLDKKIVGKKIGWVKEFFELGIDPEIKKALELARKKYEEMGCRFVELSMPYLEYGIPVYYIIQTAEVSSNLGRYDGIKYGHSSAKSDDLIDHYFKSRDEGFGREAKRRIMLGTFVLSAGFYDAYYKKAMQVRTLIKKDFDDALTKVDALLAPVTPTTAFKMGEKDRDPLEMYLADIFTASVNLAGHPAISLPCGFSGDDLPIGMQVIGRHFEEETILNLAYQYEKATDDESWRKRKIKV